MNELGDAEMRSKIKQGMDSIRAGRTIPPEKVKEEIAAFKRKWKKTAAFNDGRRAPDYDFRLRFNEHLYY